MAAKKFREPRGPTGRKRALASRDNLFDEVRRVARDELRIAYPNLTDKIFDRFAELYGPIAEEPRAHEHMRAIRAAIDAACEHLRKLPLVPDALEGPDRQLLDVLRALNLFPLPSALDHAERTVGFRAHDVPELRDRRSLVEGMLGSIGLRCTPRHFALMSLAVGFTTMNGEWRDATVANIIDRETKSMRSELARLKEEGATLVRGQIDRVVSAGKRGRPKKRN